VITEVYRTDDGEIFDTMDDARCHERGMFKAWLEGHPKIDIKKLIDRADNEMPEEFCGTNRDWHMIVARAAFNMENE
jgi:hypothetical protein